MSTVCSGQLPLLPKPLVGVLGGDVPGVPLVLHPGQPALLKLGGPNRSLGILQEGGELGILAQNL